MTSDTRIYFLGESFVNGTGDRTHLGWTGRLCQSLSQQGAPVTYYNLGIRGETSTQLLARWEAEVDRRFSIECDNRIVFCFGVNDTTWEDNKTRVELATSIRNARQILSVAQAKCPVLMIGPAAIADIDQNVRTQMLAQHFASLCQAHGIPFLNILTSLRQSQTWMAEVAAGDGAHPDASGYAELAQLIQNSSVWQNWVTAVNR